MPIKNHLVKLYRNLLKLFGALFQGIFAKKVLNNQLQMPIL